jgi:hypothetical protein
MTIRPSHAGAIACMVPVHVSAVPIRVPIFPVRTSALPVRAPIASVHVAAGPVRAPMLLNVLAMALAAFLAGCGSDPRLAETGPAPAAGRAAPAPAEHAATSPPAPEQAPAAPRRARDFASEYPAEHAALLATEHALVREPLQYARKDRAERFRPAGMYFEPHARTLWVWSRAHPEQRGFALRDGHWQPAATRTGPVDTRRCVALQRTPLTLCVGLLEPGGVRAFGARPFHAALPARGGFRDLAVNEALGRVYVIDARDDVLWVLNLRGRVQGRVPLTAGAYALGTLGDDALFVLAGNQPHLSVLPLDRHGIPGAPAEIETAAPFRAARFDGALLWTAGYRQARVRRHDGPVENLETFLYAYRKDDLTRGVLAPVHAVDLATARLADAVAVTPDATGVLVAVSGNHRLVRVNPAQPGAAVLARPSAFVTSDVLAEDAWIFTVGLLDDALYVHRRRDLDLVETVPLAAGPSPAADTDYAMGEVLFYGKALWADTPSNQFTCNSCHWEGGNDHRVHPGYRESRWELGRPAAGVGMLSPIFTPGQASSITVAVNGFLRALDERYWTARDTVAWLHPVEVEIAPGRRVQLSPHEVRRALLTYLARLPVEPGFLRAPGQPFSASAQRGAALFWRDCARCHQPTPHMAAPDMLERDAALDRMMEHPLAFGAARHEKTGVLPYFSEHGNRVSPLTQLGRGGPFFSNGSARTLAEVLQRTDPSQRLVHAPENAATPIYQPDQVQDLIDFLLSI